MSQSTAPEHDDVAALTAAVLDEETRRLEEEVERAAAGRVVLADDLLPGVGEQSMPMRKVLKRGGMPTITVLSLLNLVDEFDNAAMAVLAPDIQKTLGISDTWLAVLGTLGGLLIVIGAVPVGWLADRARRTWVVAGVSGVLGVFMLLTGVVKTVWQTAIVRTGSGFGKAAGPAATSLLSDAYPIAGRARVFAIYNLANPIGLLIGPVLAGAVAVWAGGDAGWRWAFIVLSLPTVVLSFVMSRVKEPRRGQNETEAVFGQEASSLEYTAPTISAAFGRLRKIKTFYYVLIGIGIMGFALFSFGIFFSLYLEQRFGLGALERGYVISIAAIGGVLGAPLGGIIADRLFRENPPRAVRVSSFLLLAFILGPVSMYAPNLPSMVAILALGQLGLGGAFTGLTAILASVIPYRLRAQGFALVGIYLLFFGAFIGAIITGSLSEAFGERTALMIVVPPPIILGTILMSLGAKHVKYDMSMVVEEMLEEREEQARLADGGDRQAIQVRNLDFSYGPVQVLFDVNIDVHEGEVLALLGTNGAGKSTLLRAISGLGHPDRGVVRLHGRNVTFAEAEDRVDMGLVQVSGGKAVFPELTVRDNLHLGAYTLGNDQALIDERIDEVVALFPQLAERMQQVAGSLSGGQQQMLAIAKGLLLRPKVLLLDELSLGLAPVVVQEILEIVEGLRAQGLTMVIVEQSVNVALAMADRAVFMEKGRVRFEGPAQELRERDDLVRAVFLGGEGG